MNEWLAVANSLIVSVLGSRHSNVEQIVIGFIGLLVLFIALKSLTKNLGSDNRAWFRRFLSGAFMLFFMLLFAVISKIFIVPHLHTDGLRYLAFFLMPMMGLFLIAVPLIKIILKKDYGSALMVTFLSLLMAVIAAFIVGFILDSLKGSDKEFKVLKRRTNVIDDFINH